MLKGTFGGYRLIESPYMCDKVQARKHKKKRINKKWLKRYGMKEKPWSKLLITDSGMIIGHPKMIARLMEDINLKEVTR